MITLPIVRNWNVRTPDLFRYMDQKHIDEFFDKGRLRLSSFKQFAKHIDEQRADSREGQNVLVGMGQSFTVLARVQHGMNSLILCTSTVQDDTLMRTFGTNGYFCIKNSTAFGAAIAGRLPGFVEGIEGLCIYGDERIISRRISMSSIEELKVKPEDNNVSLDNIFALTGQIGGADVFFVKLNQYRHQSEHRFVWNVCYEVEDAIFVECPEAIQFCEKIT